VLDAAEALGLAPDGRLFALNSYENRVYRVGRIDAEPVVLKFYRAGRWSDQQILEEHAFGAELAAEEIPVAAPLLLAGSTLHRHLEFRLAAFPLCAGTAPELDRAGARELLGRTLARIHAVGARRISGAADYGARTAGRARARQPAAIAVDARAHASALRRGQRRAGGGHRGRFSQVAPLTLIRLHGDCHLGNILWQQRGPLLVDLDDCVNGPRMQDLWMFLSGNADEQQGQWAEIVEGYNQFGAIEFRELRLVEPLRAVRMLNHAAWVAERWADPAFPRAFPWAAEARFWEGYVGDLMQQCEAWSSRRCWREPVIMSPAVREGRGEGDAHGLGSPDAGRHCDGCDAGRVRARCASGRCRRSVPATEPRCGAARDANPAPRRPGHGGRGQLGAFDHPDQHAIRAVGAPGDGNAADREVALVTATDVAISHIRASFQPGDGLQLQAERNLDISDPGAGAVIEQELSVVPQQAGVLSLNATVVVDMDGGSLARSYSIPLIAGDNPAPAHTP
jgi:Ser/Thr protein kinase RdoA (MazF antagonist)